MRATITALAIGANLGALAGIYLSDAPALSDYAPAGIVVTALISLTALAMKASK